MKFKLVAAFAFACVLLAVPGLARAQTPVRVSATGGGSTCSQASPCATFSAAISALPSNSGVINCLTPGTYAGAITITTALTINCPGGTVTGLITVNAPGLTVALQGILVGCSAANGTNCGVMMQAGSLALDTVTVNGTVDGLTITGGTAVVTNSRFNNNEDGIVVNPASGTTVVQLSHVTVTNSFVVSGDGGQGINISSGTGGESQVNLTDSVVSNNSIGIVVDEGSSRRQFLTIQRSSITNNGVGIDADGAQAFILIGESSVAWNSFSGISVGNGAVFSCRNNQVNGNGTDISGTVNTVGLQ